MQYFVSLLRALVGFVATIVLSLLAGIVVAIVLSTLAVQVSRAAPSCMTERQARAVYPSEHLYWHTNSHCWDASPGRRERRDRRSFARPVSQPVAVPPREIDDTLSSEEPLSPAYVTTLIQRRWTPEQLPSFVTSIAPLPVPSVPLVDEHQFNALDAQAKPLSSPRADVGRPEVASLLVPAIFVMLLVGVFWTAPKIDMALDVWGFRA